MAIRSAGVMPPVALIAAPPFELRVRLVSNVHLLTCAVVLSVRCGGPSLGVLEGRPGRMRVLQRFTCSPQRFLGGNRFLPPSSLSGGASTPTQNVSLSLQSGLTNGALFLTFLFYPLPSLHISRYKTRLRGFVAFSKCFL